MVRAGEPKRDYMRKKKEEEGGLGGAEARVALTGALKGPILCQNILNYSFSHSYPLV